jgi:hypothetical protein
VPEQAAWEADRLFNARNEAVVEQLRSADVAFVVHLGDVPHPVPGLAAHDEALQVASELYGRLDVPLYVVPGNHDIGDKPKPTSPVPGGRPEHRAAFEARWGPLWQRFEHEGVAFLAIDTPVLNTGTDRESEQWDWLQAQVEALHGRRWVALLHYPPFLLRRDEPEHYDNLAEPARSRLLALLAQAEATFCGHVHHAFWHVAERIHLLPSTAFVRPGFRELAPVGSGRAFGRDDVHKLGYLIVHVDDDGLHLEPVRSHDQPSHPLLRPGRRPPPVHPLGVTLRHRIDRVVDVPADGLDPFSTKQARDDQPLLALLEAGVRRLRVPMTAALVPRSRARLRALEEQAGFEVRLYGTDPPSADLSWVCERVGPLEHPLPGPWAPVRRGELRDGERFSHFPTVGFLAEEARPDEAVVRVPSDRPVWDHSTAGVCIVELPRATESSAFTDDEAVAGRVAEALITALAFPDRALYLDGWVDHDRGYYPRHLLVDRAGEPRLAHRVLRHLNQLLPRSPRVERREVSGGWCFTVVGVGACWVPTEVADLPAGIDLGSGAAVAEGRSRVPRWV